MDLFDTRMSNYKTEKDEDQCCSLQLVESIPTGLNFSDSFEHMKTYETWKQMLDGAQKFVDIAALYWNLNESDYPTSNAGKLVYQSIINAAKRGVKVRIAQDISQGLSNNKDSRWLAENGLAQVRTLNFSKLLGSGVLHTKFIIVDLKHIYIGSANMDWKSLTEVKELGVYVKNCPCVATDLYRIFAVYWRYWPILDDVLRSAAFRGVNVRMLVSKWDHSRAEEIEYLRSMIVINPALPTKKGARGKIEVKLFEVPSTKVQKKIKFARVNHNKYMLTDDTAYIGTSNWVGDYFISTAGVGLSMKSTDQDSIVQQLQEVFDRDWVSPYTKRLV
uniref:PLD phosphodiesterase domain-containing protein n=1 Tax=Heterorhabditis bacteriophora TaxID=37862 RepID=A0A1I7WQD2_HETBA